MAEQKYAINPYNFIPFEGEPERRPLDAYFSEPLESGWIDVRLTVRTPLIIPNGTQFTPETVGTKNGKPAIHKSYSFFRLPDGTTAVPGSSLRGMLRSVYEAASNSCLPFLQRDPKGHSISQRTPIYASFKERGLLQYDPDKDQWQLRSAKIYLEETEKRFVQRGTFYYYGKNYQNAQMVDFAPTKDGRGFKLGEGNRRGYLQFNIPVAPGKYHVAVLEPGEVIYPKPGDPVSGGTRILYSSLRGSVYDTTRNLKKKQTTSGPQFDLLSALNKAAKVGGMVPCYYFIVSRGDRKLVYLSGAAVGRVQQRRSWSEIMGPYSPCISLDAQKPAGDYNHHEGVCPACALFGTADTRHASSEARGAKGRLRFTDALPDPERRPEDQLKMNRYTLPILGEPRPSSFEFYLRKPTDPDGGEVTYWNFDYYGVRQSSVSGAGDTVEYTDYHDLEEATPRGRKMYWHWQGRPRQDFRKSHLNSTMEAIDKGSLRFRIYYDGITHDQLQDLLWVITLGENSENGNQLHKLGHGKPVGYGSVKLTVLDLARRVVERTEDGSLRAAVRHEKPETSARSSTLCEASVDAILRMSDFCAAGDQRIAYLTGMMKGKDGKPDRQMIFTWFQKNRKNADSVLTLPEPTDPDLSLPTARED